MSAAHGFEEFVTIVDCGSLTAAAGALGIPRPTLSRRLARLEERLGVRLLHRTTRRMEKTPAGDALYPRARRIVDSAREAEAAVQRLDGVPRGLLRVSIPHGLPQPMLAGWLAEFLGRYPDVQLELVASSAHVDLVGDSVDVALRVGEVLDPTLVVRTIAHDGRLAVASPGYLSGRGTPATPDDLTHHDCIRGFRAGTIPERRWPLRDGGWVPVDGTLTSNEMGLRLEAAKQGLGIALVVDRIAEVALEAGELVAVLPDVLGRRERLALVYPAREHLDPKVRVFVDFLFDHLTAVRAAWDQRPR